MNGSGFLGFLDSDSLFKYHLGTLLKKIGPYFFPGEKQVIMPNFFLKKNYRPKEKIKLGIFEALHF